MNVLEQMVLPDGTLDETYIIKREILYTGTNGRHVERFHLSPTESYVFKPLTNEGQEGMEGWAYQYVLPALPPIYPKLLAQSSGGDHSSGTPWMILEDMGPLNHAYDEEMLLVVAGLIAAWHAVPAASFPGIPMRGPKPLIEEIVEDVLLHQERLLDICTGHGVPAAKVRTLLTQLDVQAFSQVRVLSHGDLHPGNYALSNGKMIVLDWEHAHLNTPLWDIYHLIDMSHPLFPKPIKDDVRQHVLAHYLDQIELRGVTTDRFHFIQEYYVFTAVFSMWMVLLIDSDLHKRNDRWPTEQLETQLREAVCSLLQCANRFVQGLQHTSNNRMKVDKVASE